MSFKDDFLEALRSVKRDLFNDSDIAPAGASVSMSESDGKSGNEENDSVPGVPAARNATPPPESPAVNSGEPQKDGSADDYASDYGSVEILAGSVHNDTGDPPSFDYIPPQSGIEPSPLDGSSSETGDAMEKLDESGSRFVYGDNFGNGDGRQIFDFSVGDVFDDEKTIISRNTVIRGVLQTDDSIRLLGQVLGDIECKSNIVVAGKVRGNTTAANAYVVDAQVDGNMTCEDSISVNDDAWILGNIRARQADVGGKIKGNLEIRHNVSIGSSSSVIGNISADELEIKRGAFINGQIIMYSPSRDVLDRFDQFDG